MTDDQRQMVKDCLDRDRNMSAWECDFIQSLSDRSEDKNYPLSEKQEEILDRIWNKVTERG